MNKFIILLFFIVLLINNIFTLETVEIDEDVNSDIEILSDRNFEELTTANPNETWMVEFYAPWCFHCKNLKKTYNELATIMKQESPLLKVAKIDCVANPKQCKRFGVRSYPTVKVIKGDTVYDMKGEKNLNTLKEFLKGGFEEAGVVQNKLPSSIIPKVIELTDATFPSPHDGNWLIYFYLPRCIYCEKYEPAFEALPSADFSKAPNEKYNFGKVNCEINTETCNLYRIEYFPNVKFFENSTNIYRNFNHEPTTDNLKEFVIFYHKNVEAIKRPWSMMFSLFEEAIREFVWLFLLVSFLFGFFICYIFYGMPAPTSSVQTKIKKSE